MRAIQKKGLTRPLDHLQSARPVHGGQSVTNDLRRNRDHRLEHGDRRDGHRGILTLMTPDQPRLNLKR